MDDWEGNHKYDMILKKNTIIELQIYLSFSNNTVRRNRGVYKVCTSPAKDMTNSMSHSQFHNKSFQKEILWDRKHKMDFVQCTRCISADH